MRGRGASPACGTIKKKKKECVIITECVITLSTGWKLQGSSLQNLYIFIVRDKLVEVYLI